MGVASGCGEQEVGVASRSGWNLWVWLVGVVVRKYIDFLILLILLLYLFFFAAASLLFVHFFYVRSCLKKWHGNVLADEAANNIILVCRKYCLDIV